MKLVILHFVCMHLCKHLTMELNQKPSPRGAYYRAFKRVRITYARTWGIKRGEDVCSKGVHYWKLTVIDNVRQSQYWILLTKQLLGTITRNHPQINGPELNSQMREKDSPIHLCSHQHPHTSLCMRERVCVCVRDVCVHVCLQARAAMIYQFYDIL